MRIVKNGDVHVSVPFGMPRQEVLRFIEEHRDWIAKAQTKTRERVDRQREFFDSLPQKTKEQRVEAARQLSALTEPLVASYALKIGVKPGAIEYKPMKSRWGRCNVRTRAICFSTYLLLLPEWSIEHVVVHELCHLLEPTHKSRFYRLMDQHFPRWREARKEVRALSTKRLRNNDRAEA